MIGNFEPEEVSHRPVEFEFYHAGKVYKARVSKSLTHRLERFIFTGQFGAAMLADPCSTILGASLHASSMEESAARRQAREERRKAKEALIEAEVQARRAKPVRW